MWNELRGTYQIVTGSANGAITLPGDGAGNTKGLILIGWFFHTATSAAQTCAFVTAGLLGSFTLALASTTFEKHFNHLLFTPITSITIANFTANDTWMFETVRARHT
jgi:hypothetical protein